MSFGGNGGAETTILPGVALRELLSVLKLAWILWLFLLAWSDNSSWQACPCWLERDGLILPDNHHLTVMMFVVQSHRTLKLSVVLYPTPSVLKYKTFKFCEVLPPFINI